MDYSEQSERMLSFFNLKQDPFGALVDSMVYSGAGGRYEIVETIRHLLTYSQQDSLVAGMPGSGKRTLAQQVLKLIDDYWRVVWIDAQEVQSLEVMFREIIGQFGLGLKPEADAETLLQQIINITAERGEQEDAFLIVVQHADQLAPEVESALLSLRTQVGSLDYRIRQLWLAEDVSHFSIPLDEEDWYIHLLETLSDQDAGQYLRDRLAAAGSVNDFPITDKDIARLNQLAGGLPANLNELARDYLISGTFKTTEQKQTFPLTHVVAGAAALCLIAIAFLYQVNDEPQTVLTLPAAENSGELSEVEKRLAEAVAKVEAKQQAGANTEALLDVPAESDGIVGLGDSPEGGQESDVVVVSNTGNALSESVPAEIEPDPEVVSQASDSVPVSAAPLSTPRNLGQLLSTAGDNEFTMQLIGVRDRAKLGPLMTGFNDPDNLEIITTSHEGKPWYVLIYGRYATKADAQQDVSALPGAFSDVQPWIRSFKSIRDDLK